MRQTGRVILSVAAGVAVLLGVIAIGYAAVFLQAQTFAIFDPLLVGLVGAVSTASGLTLLVLARRGFARDARP